MTGSLVPVERVGDIAPEGSGILNALLVHLAVLGERAASRGELDQQDEWTDLP